MLNNDQRHDIKQQNFRLLFLHQQHNVTETVA